MATKRTVRKGESDKRRDAEAVRKLSRRAATEVSHLLKRNRAGSITRAQLETRLEEVEKQLKEMILFMHKLI